MNGVKSVLTEQQLTVFGKVSLCSFKEMLPTQSLFVSMGIFSSVTVVAHYSIFWVKLPGPIIYQHGVTPHPPQSHTTPPPGQTTTASILPEPVSVTPALLMVTPIPMSEYMNFNVK